MKTRLFFLAAAAALAACSSDNEGQTPADDGEIRLSSGLAVQETRGGTALQGNQIVQGSGVVGVFINENIAENETATATYTQNQAYTADGNGNLTSTDGTKAYFPTSGNGVNIHAYAPYADGQTLNGTYTFSVKTNQTSDADYIASDLLYGAPENSNPVARTSNTVNIKFKHLLSKVIVNLKAGDGITDARLQGATVKLKNVYTSNSLNLSTGGLSTPSDAAKGEVTVTKFAADAQSFSAAAIVAPTNLSVDEDFIEIILADESASTQPSLFYAAPSGGINLASGMVYTYDITVKLTGITTTSSVEEWVSSGEAISGNATMKAGS